jgi:hypothetical protein
MNKPAIAILFGLALLIVGECASFGQAGSTGGTLGKTDKSASGGDESGLRQTSKPGGPRKADQKTARGSCQKIVGTWTWRGGLGETTFNAGGTGRNSFQGGITWTCANGMVIANWPSVDIVDRITIAQDGNSLLITNSRGETFSVTRK